MYFTFHSGTILIVIYIIFTKVAHHFTFHSGTILMHGHIHFRPLKYSLYIPLWYDSNNTNIFVLCGARGCFTFHSGTILIEFLEYYEYQTKVFTFHSGTILIFLIDNIVNFFSCFTFHSGTILISM